MKLQESMGKRLVEMSLYFLVRLLMNALRNMFSLARRLLMMNRMIFFSKIKGNQRYILFECSGELRYDAFLLFCPLAINSKKFNKPINIKIKEKVMKLKNGIWCLVIIFLLAVGLCHAASPQIARYGRLAIVAAPGAGADPKYAPIILQGVAETKSKSMEKLPLVDCLPNETVNLATTPPSVKLRNPGNYDAIALLVYSQSGGMIYLNINLLDARTGAELWTHQLHAKDTEAGEDKERMRNYGHLGRLVPKRLYKYFYRD